MLKWRRTNANKSESKNSLSSNLKIKIFLCTLLLLVGCNASSDPINNSTLKSGTTKSPASDISNGSNTTFKITCAEAQFVKLLNIYRNSHGLNSVNVSRTGVITARWHTQDMINHNYFSHTEPDGRTFSQRASNFGYPSHAENIAAGNAAADKTFCQWRNSKGHNANMLGRHQSIGIGLAVGKSQYGVYWSNGFSNAVGDEISEPLTSDAGCVMPRGLPFCPVKN